MGSRPYSFPSPFVSKIYKTSFVTISKVEVIILIVSFLLMLGLTFLIQKTKIGIAMRATAQDKDTASLMGININKVITATFAVGSALGAWCNGRNLFPFCYSDDGVDAGVERFCSSCLSDIGSIPGRCSEIVAQGCRRWEQLIFPRSTGCRGFYDLDCCASFDHQV